MVENFPKTDLKVILKVIGEMGQPMVLPTPTPFLIRLLNYKLNPLLNFAC